MYQFFALVVSLGQTLSSFLGLISIVLKALPFQFASLCSVRSSAVHQVIDENVSERPRLRRFPAPDLPPAIGWRLRRKPCVSPLLSVERVCDSDHAADLHAYGALQAHAKLFRKILNRDFHFVPAVSDYASVPLGKQPISSLK